MKKLALTIASVAMTSFSTTTLADPAVTFNTGQCVQAGLLESAADPTNADNPRGPAVFLFGHPHFDGKVAGPIDKGNSPFLFDSLTCELIPGPPN